MKWRSRAWSTLKGRALRITALVIVWTELVLWAVWDRPPNDVLTVIALGVLFPATQQHVKNVLGSGGPGPSSPSSESQSSPSPPSSSPRGEEAGEHRP